MSLLRSFAAAAPLTLLLGAMGGCSSTGAPPAPPPTCSNAQALTALPLFGTSLGPKELALTFDDGPASRTLELSAYLKGKGIRAGFFVNGFMVVGAAEKAILQQLVLDGHVIANHTQNHLSLTTPPPTNATIVKEVTDTDTIIAPYVPHNRFMFRAPFGEWDANAHAALQASPMSKYIGHIEWEYGGRRTATTAADWACWTRVPKLTTQECGDLYMTEIDGSVDKRGIVLMHDDYVGGTNDGAGNTIDMVKYLVPLLVAKGYTFKRVDEVPAIAALLPPIPITPDAGADAGVDAGAEAGVDAGAPPTTKPQDEPPKSAPPPSVTPDPCAAPAQTARHNEDAH